MHRQVGNLKINEKAIAFKGLMIRHLVMPENIADTDKILEYIANEVSKDICRKCHEKRDFSVSPISNMIVCKLSF